MSVVWPSLLPDESVLFETGTPVLVSLALWLFGALIVFGLVSLLQATGAVPSGLKATVYLGLAAVLLPLLALLNIGARLVVTTHRLAIRRPHGARFSILYAEITELEKTPLGLRITSARRPAPERLDFIAGAAEVAQEIRHRSHV